MSKKKGKSLDEMRQENPDLDRDIERTFHMIDAANATKETPAALIAEHNKIQDHIAAQTRAFNDYLTPFRKRDEEISNALLAKLIELNDGKPEAKRASLSTEHGTAYLSTIVTPKIEDKEQYLDFVLADWDNLGAMLQIGAPQKQALQDYQDSHDGALPPHVSISSFTRVNIRRS